MGFITFLLNLLPATLSIPLPAESLSFDVAGHKITVATPAVSINVLKG